tara:strand:+ start:458 stop:1942 length:1485 start_codon:yes stop_codon:yes gene_type:complete
MTFNANNFNWSELTDPDFPNDKIFGSDFILTKYPDLDNKEVKEKKKIKAKVNNNTGDITLSEVDKDGNETKIQTRSKNGEVTIFEPILNNQLFSENNSDTLSQYKNITELSKLKFLDENRLNFKPTFAENLDLFGSDNISSLNMMSFQEGDILGDFNFNTDFGAEPAAASEAFSSGNKEFVSKGSIVGKTFLRYPLTEVPDALGFDFIRIRSYEYTPGGSGALSISNGRLSAKDRLIKDATPIETVILPMQPNFSESNAVQWGGDTINPLQLLGASAASTLIEGIGNIGQPGMIEGVAEGFKELTSDIMQAIQDPNTGPALIAYFAGQAVGANILGRTAGVTLNPNLELLFKGPNLRTFNFNFRFTPRSEDEAFEIKQIIRCFKKNMAVRRSASNMFLLTPNIFTLEYIYNSTGGNAGQTHPYLNMFKPMAMTSFNVNYTPDGTYMTYGDGSLTQYDVQMSFGEIEPIFADDYDASQSGDLDVGDYDSHINMGY